MTPDLHNRLWRAFHEASRLNRYQRQELDALEKLLHEAAGIDSIERDVLREP